MTNDSNTFSVYLTVIVSINSDLTVLKHFL